MAASGSEKEQYIHIYPNPADDLLNIDYEITDGEKGEIIVADITGREVTRQILESNSKTLTLSTKYLPNGIYQLRLVIDDELLGNQKLVIVK